MQDQRKQRIRAVGQLVLLASGLACGPCLSAAEVGRGPARVYVVDFEQSGNSPAFPDLNRFLTSFLRLHLTSIPSIAISGPNEPAPCDAKPGLSLQHSDGESQSVSSRASFYTVRGSLELHNPQGGGNAEVLASYQLTKASGCTQGEVVLLAQSDKFSLAEALEHFGSIADLLATKLKGELARRIPIDIYRIGESGAAPNELGTGQLLTRYLMIRVSQVDDLKPQLAEASDAGAPYSVKGQVTFSRQPDGRRMAMAKLRIISKDGGKEYVLDPAPEGMIRTDVRDDLGDFALQAADATVDWLNRVRFAREAGIEAVPVAALLIKAGELLCSNQGSGSCSPQPESALVALNRIAPEERGATGWGLIGQADLLVSDKSGATTAFEKALSTPEAQQPSRRIPLLKLAADAWYDAESYPNAATRYEQYFHMTSNQRAAFPEPWKAMPDSCVKWARSLVLNKQGLQALDVLLEARGALGSSALIEDQLKSVVQGLAGKDMESAVEKLGANGSDPSVSSLRAVLMSSLGNSYLEGRGVPQDYKLARQWSEKAADAGNADAMDHLGMIYEYGYSVTQNYQQALQWYEKAAAAGNVDSFNRLATFYYYGNGVPKDPRETRRWCEKAAEAGDPQGTYNLGYLYDDGIGGPQDYQQAKRLYEKAAAGGNVHAMNNLGHLYQDGRGVAKDYQQAVQWYEKAAAAGHSGAMYNLGYLFDFGQGVPQDYQQARQWYLKGAAAGDADSMNNLGVLYEHGSGVTQNYQLAKEWYDKGAAGGSATSMYNLGLMYEYGRGVARNYQLAKEQLEKAGQAGNVDAMNQLASLYYTGEGLARDYQLARQWSEKAAATGDALATFRLGNLYEDGLGVKRDYVHAVELYRKAAEAGNADAMYHLAGLYEKGRGVTNDAQEARQWYEKAAALGNDGAKKWLASHP